ncbi:MAG TPA: alpha/beta fold hydrolase [Methanoregulaceae archaeon]|nr:alpha/beta fold hydrolase [Methanoregulaceae archaeon]
MSTETRRVLTDKSGSPREQAERMFTVLFPREWRDSHDPWDFCPPVYETTPEDQAARQAAVLSSWDGVCGRLAGIRSPTLVVTGTDDVIIPPANADILARNIPGARLVRFRDCGHGLMYQVPAPFAAVVVGFFGG